MKKITFFFVLCLLFSGRNYAQSSLIEDALFKTLIREFLMINTPYKVIDQSLDTCISEDKKGTVFIKKIILVSNDRKICLISYPFQDSTKVSCYVAEVYSKKADVKKDCPLEYAFENNPKKQFYLKGERYAVLDSQLTSK